ncbi:CAZyme family AA7 [Aspergillus niger]|uniref:FAD-binding PCMH-type domain-containing protein n=1 Tax=Aspergillus niger TaxID=5061 RepID=A0A9W6E6F0_ASPNG|nr:CAZyme family AA7 [Aspergillus niger]KAI2858473.1 CAZyme family AA7 [Aspergillus niger]KAI2914324.1 CAZyme family AA7 [Aspergillus niger]KAI2942005.1 CAZyme family AA7 [Aspergillus niger]KAI2966153.1 CAZyme family AA7 [Aspergillus niger]
MMLPRLLSLIALPALAAANCKTAPGDAAWPSIEEWSALNQSIGGSLIRTAPAASSCYAGNPLSSPYNCSSVKDHWSYAAYHAAWPESNDYSIYNNNSCVPPGVSGYTKDKGCSIGGMPQYIVNATTEEQVATAMSWASQRNIRVVVKSTGHDLNGRSTGAYSLSIWTHNFKRIHHNPTWHLPGTNKTADVLICGGGNNWGTVYTTAVTQFNRTVVGGEDATVGLGGLIQNGGHGLLSSHYGLASDNVYQVTVVTPEGHILTANDAQNQDLFWAIRGAGGGQFGVVTEFILQTHPIPDNVVTGGLTFYASSKSNASGLASWTAFAETAAQIPDLMDSGITGTIMAATGESASTYTGLDEVLPGPAVIISLIAYNSTVQAMNATLHNLSTQLTNHTTQINTTLTPPTSYSYWSYIKPNFLASQSAGASSLFTSRLLGKSELSSLPQPDLIHYLQQISASQSGDGTLLIFGLQGGRGTANVPEQRRGSVLPSWRSAYAHVMAYGGSVNDTGDPAASLAEAAEWYESVLEPVWRDWAPNMGAYMNEGNPFSSTWKRDYYGDGYERLAEVKRRYDPNGSLWVYAGVGSDLWEFDLRSGLLCRV